MPWIGPFTIESISGKNTCVLKRGDRLIKKQQHLKNIKKFYEHTSDGDDKKIEIISTQSSKDSVNPQWFRPISKHWMIQQCKQMNLDVKNVKCVVKKRSKILKTPKTFIDVLGDGNCWYRCISMWVTGSEDYHEHFRTNVYKVILFLKQYFRKMYSFVYCFFFCSDVLD